MNKYDVMVQKLTEQVAELSRDRAIYFGLWTESESKNEQLVEELEKLKQVKVDE